MPVNYVNNNPIHQPKNQHITIIKLDFNVVIDVLKYYYYSQFGIVKFKSIIFQTK